MTATIFARATPPGRSGIAVIRISGPDAFAAADALAPLPSTPRRASLRNLRDPATGALIDQGIVIGFPGPESFSGEDMVEIHCHGGPAVIAALLAGLGRVPGLRPAEAGEFTRRALENDRLDLSQAEGLADLLAAETEAQRRQALALMRGALSGRASGWRESLIRALALIEASIDFADEDIPVSVLEEAAGLCAAVLGEMECELAGAVAAERIREGFEVALVGRPNVGKSTLLNALAGRSVAITAATAGTTRDVVELRTDLRGLPVTFLDMAGIRVACDPIEREGVARALERLQGADLRLFLDDGSGAVDEYATHYRKGDLCIQCKADLRDGLTGLAVSGLTGMGLDGLMTAITEALSRRAATATVPSHARHRDAIERSAEALRAAECLLDQGEGVEMAAGDIHAAMRAIDFLVGKADVESVLDVVFRSFCIGK
jgi:tRNA modification GTPase